MGFVRKSMAIAAFGAAMLACVAGGPVAAAGTDYGVNLAEGARFTLSNSRGSANFSATATSFSIMNPDSFSTSLNAGSFGGSLYGVGLTFNLDGMYSEGQLLRNYDTATLTLPYNSVVGAPVITLRSTTSDARFGLIPVGYAGLVGQPFTLANSDVPGTVKLSLGSTYAHDVNGLSNLFKQSNPTVTSYLQIAISAASSPVSGNAGAGVPGPIAGAGLPFLVGLAGLAWLRKRRGAITA